MPYYVETSAVLKLVRDELHTDALREWWHAHDGDGLWSSDLLAVEAERAVSRADGSLLGPMRQILRTIPQLGLDRDVCERACTIGPQTLRSPDALHLSAALELQPSLDGIVTYDERLADAARHHGVTVVQPIAEGQ